MKLVMEVTTRRPIGEKCPACATQSKILHTWVFIATPRVLAANKSHSFPFSFLLPGNLPATTRSSLATVSYKLAAEATPKVRPPVPTITEPGRPLTPKRTDSFKTVTLTQPLHISRSILPTVEPRHSHRIFPPTSLSATVTLPSVIYPGATDDVDITINGLNIPDTKLRWSLRKITWRLDELAKVVSPACANHANKVGGTEGKGILYEDTRTIGAGDLKSGWKHDNFAGKIECVIQIGSAVQAMAACDVDAISGVHVSHNFVVECVVAEEILLTTMGPAKKGGQYQPTGNARVLRMAFPLTVTERGGMGISWDEEIPPRYEDVAWNVPPSFAQSEGSTNAPRRDSMEGIEAVEGIRRENTRSPAMFAAFPNYNRRSVAGSPSIGAPLARTDSDISAGSDRRI
jgi:arrestin-related trafficking adapter 1